MTSRTHIPRIDPEVEERAAQLLPVDPITASDEQTWLNATQRSFKIQNGESTVPITVPILESDPPGVQNGWVWINRPLKKFRWRYLNVTKEIDLTLSEDTGFLKATGWYLNILDASELGDITDISPRYRTSLVETFSGDEKVGRELSDIEVIAGKMTVADDKLEGIYEREQRTHLRVNLAEGVVIASLQSLYPKSVVNNGFGTHTVKFHGDVTNIVSVNRPIYVFSREEVEDKLKHFYLLNEFNRPAKLVVQSVSAYDIDDNETTVVIKDQFLDLTLGLLEAEWEEKLRFLPFSLKVEGSGEGKDGNFDELELVEANITNAIRLLGEDKYQVIQSAYPGAMSWVTVKQSENKKYAIVLAIQLDPEGVSGSNPATRYSNAYVRMWYSTDYLNTLQFMDTLIPMWTPGTDNTNNDHPCDYGIHGATHLCSANNINIDDDGKFVFATASWYAPGDTYWRTRVSFGHIGVAEPWLANANRSAFNETRTDEEFWYSSTYQSYPEHLAVNWDGTNRSIAVLTIGLAIGSSLDDRIFVYLQFDWDAKWCKYAGYSSFDNHNYLYQPMFSLWEDCRTGTGNGNFKYGRKFITYHRHVNGYTYCYALPIQFLENLFNNYTSWGYAGNAGGFNDAFSGSPFGGNGTASPNAVHSMVSDAHPVVYHHDKQNRRLYIFQPDGNIPFLIMIDFARTTDGRQHVEEIKFSKIPDLGKCRLNMYYKNESGSTYSDNYGGVDTSTTTSNTFLTPATIDASSIKTYLDTVYGSTRDFSISGDLVNGMTIAVGNPAAVAAGTKKFDEVIFPLNEHFYYNRTSGITNTYFGNTFPFRATHTLRSSLDPQQDLVNIQATGSEVLGEAVAKSVYIPASSQRRIIEEFTIRGRFNNTTTPYWCRPQITITPVVTTPLTPTAAKALYNLARNGTVSSWGQGSTNWSYIFTSALLNNGVLTDNAAASGDASFAQNEGRGVSVTFNRSVALKHFKIVGYTANSNVICDNVVEYWNGSTWVQIYNQPHSIANSNDGVLEFNLSGTVVSTQWRWRMINWVPNGTNYYVNEIELYEKISDYPTESVSTLNIGGGNIQSETIGRYFGSAYLDTASPGTFRNFTINLSATDASAYREDNNTALIDGLVLLPNVAYVACIEIPNSNGTFYWSEEIGQSSPLTFFNFSSYNTQGTALAGSTTGRIPYKLNIKFREGIEFEKTVLQSGQISRGLYLNDTFHVNNVDAMGPEDISYGVEGWVKTFAQPLGYGSFCKNIAYQSYGVEATYQLDSGDEAWRGLAHTSENQRTHLRDKTLLATLTWEEANNTAMRNQALFMKFPDVDKFSGITAHRWDSDGTRLYLSGPVTAKGADYGNAIYQKFTVRKKENTTGAANFGSGLQIYQVAPISQPYFDLNGIAYFKALEAVYRGTQVPLRSLSLYVRKNWNGNYLAGDPDHEITFKLYGIDPLNTSRPDFSNLIAESTHTIKLKDVAAYGYGPKWIQVTFDDVWAEMGTDMFLAVEPVNYDPKRSYIDHPQNALIDANDALLFFDFEGTTTNTTKALRKNDAGQLETWGNKSLSFYFIDTYFGETPIIAGQEDRQGYGIWATNNGSGLGRENYEHVISPTPTNPDICNIVYMECGYRQINDRAYRSGHKNTYQISVDDSAGQNKLPVFGTPRLVGQDSTATHDPNLRFAWAPILESRLTRDDKRHLDPKIAMDATRLQDGLRYLGAADLTSSMNYYTMDGALGNHASLLNNDPATPPLWTSSSALVNPSNVGKGVYRHDGFVHGTGVKFSDSDTGYQFTQRVVDLWAYYYDFFIEFEWELTAEDWLTAGSEESPVGFVDPNNLPTYNGSDYHVMPFTIHQYMYCGMFNGKYHMWLRNLYNDASYADSWISQERVPLNTPHIVRFFRHNAGDGIGMMRSFDKGETWETIHMGTEHSDQLEPGGSRYACYGLPSSTYVTYSDIAYVGRYWGNNAHDVKGLLGYVKYGIGSHEPTYTGVRAQRTIEKYRIVGNKLFGMRDGLFRKVGVSTSSSATFNYGQAIIADLNAKSSKVPTNDQAFKFRGVVPEGTKMGLKVTLSENDNKLYRNSVQGLMFNYLRNIL